MKTVSDINSFLHIKALKYDVQVYKYEPNSGEWTSMPKLSVARDEHTAMLVKSNAFHCTDPPAYIKKAETDD